MNDKDRPLQFIDLSEAIEALAEIGIQINERQIKRAVEPDAFGKRKLPFFKDPIDGRLKIEKNQLIRIYEQLQMQAFEGSAMPVYSDGKYSPH